MKEFFISTIRLILGTVIGIAAFLAASFPIYGIFKTPTLNVESVLVLVLSYALLFSSFFSKFENLDVENVEEFTTGGKVIFYIFVGLLFVSILVLFK